MRDQFKSRPISAFLLCFLLLLSWTGMFSFLSLEEYNIMIGCSFFKTEIHSSHWLFSLSYSLLLFSSSPWRDLKGCGIEGIHTRRSLRYKRK
ncbi:hypothetical protein BDF14DRAFT_1807925 [Spinellus fusiger]|nr:hypothetical protein BDF14DRAFT_1807925 [Spinellus fusiger]